MCLGVKHTLSNGESAKDGAQWLPSALPFWELHLCKSPEYLKSWLKRKKNTKLGVQDIVGKVLKFRCLKCPHIVHLNLKCMSYDPKKSRDSNWKFDFRPQIPLKQGSNDFRLGHAIHSSKDLFKGYKIFALYVSKNLIWWRYEHPKFQDSKNPNFGIFEKKCHLDVTLVESQRIYYRKGSGASSQRLWVM
jgi:hypothetical protein